jgi:hypothetical protein
MQKLLIIILFLLSIATASAETIKLKNGKIIEGEIVERNSEYIKIDTKDQIFKVRFNHLDETANSERIPPKTQKNQASEETAQNLSEKNFKKTDLVDKFVLSKKKISVLYLGNSLTSSNNLPSLIAFMAKARGYEIYYDSYTPGGKKLSDHARDSKVLQKIKSGHWDFVVLQEQSQYPAFSFSQVSTDVYPYAQILTQKIKEVNKDATVVFFMTMANRNGDPRNARAIPIAELATYAGMQSRINQSYLTMAKMNRAVIAPVGKVWEQVRLKAPNINLYNDDNHPNIVGTYLAACVFYVTFFHESPFSLPHPMQIDSRTADYIKEAVYEFAMLGSWDFR